jgi:hypothetical protein
MRSLAFLAATFAIVFGSLLPSAVAASSATGDPVMLCSGDRILVVYDADGSPRPKSPTPMDSLTCADCVLSALASLPPPPPPSHPAAPPRIVTVQPGPPLAACPPSLHRAGLPPPSTAPPTT